LQRPKKSLLMQEIPASTGHTSAMQQALGPQEYWDMWCLYADQPDMLDISEISSFPNGLTLQTQMSPHLLKQEW